MDVAEDKISGPCSLTLYLITHGDQSMRLFLMGDTHFYTSNMCGDVSHPNFILNRVSQYAANLPLEKVDLFVEMEFPLSRSGSIRYRSPEIYRFQDAPLTRTQVFSTTCYSDRPIVNDLTQLRSDQPLEMYHCPSNLRVHYTDVRIHTSAAYFGRRPRSSGPDTGVVAFFLEVCDTVTEILVGRRGEKADRVRQYAKRLSEETVEEQKSAWMELTHHYKIRRQLGGMPTEMAEELDGIMFREFTQGIERIKHASTADLLEALQGFNSLVMDFYLLGRLFKRAEGRMRTDVFVYVGQYHVDFYGRVIDNMRTIRSRVLHREPVKMLPKPKGTVGDGHNRCLDLPPGEREKFLGGPQPGRFYRRIDDWTRNPETLRHLRDSEPDQLLFLIGADPPIVDRLGAVADWRQADWEKFVIHNKFLSSDDRFSLYLRHRLDEMDPEYRHLIAFIDRVDPDRWAPGLKVVLGRHPGRPTLPLTGALSNGRLLRLHALGVGFSPDPDDVIRRIKMERTDRGVLEGLLDLLQPLRSTDQTIDRKLSDAILDGRESLWNRCWTLRSILDNPAFQAKPLMVERPSLKILIAELARNHPDPSCPTIVEVLHHFREGIAGWTLDDWKETVYNDRNLLFIKTDVLLRIYDSHRLINLDPECGLLGRIVTKTVNKSRDEVAMINRILSGAAGAKEALSASLPLDGMDLLQKAGVEVVLTKEDVMRRTRAALMRFNATDRRDLEELFAHLDQFRSDPGVDGQLFETLKALPSDSRYGRMVFIMDNRNFIGKPLLLDKGALKLMIADIVEMRHYPDFKSDAIRKVLEHFGPVSDGLDDWERGDWMEAIFGHVRQLEPSFLLHVYDRYGLITKDSGHAIWKTISPLLRPSELTVEERGTVRRITAMIKSSLR